MNNTKKIIGLIIAIIMFAALIAGATYAILQATINTTNQTYNTTSLCFLVDYNINNVDNSQDITGTLFPSGTIAKGLSGRVGLKRNDDCPLNGIGTLKLHINSGTSTKLMTQATSYCEDRSTLEPISGIQTEADCHDEEVNGRWRGYSDPYCESTTTLERLDYKQSACASNGGTWITSSLSPLKYAIYDNAQLTGAPIAKNHIPSSAINSDFTLLDNIAINDTQKYYYIYIWLDGYHTDDSFAEAQFSGYISASAIQVEN